MKGKEKQVRFDRVLCGTRVHPRSIEMVGTEPIEALDGVWPSDHFGLICEVDIRETGRSQSDTLLMLGQSCRNYGAFLQERLKEAHACLSVGSDPESPSLSFKASKLFTNEDALLVRSKGERYLMAVADGHFGLDTSHALINRLAGADFPESLEELKQTVHNLQQPSLQSGAGSSLTVAHLDLRNGLVWGVYTGDSTACLLTGSEYQPLTESNTRFVYFNRPLEGDEWQTFQAAVPPGTLLLLFTDGINECHYRSPDTSIQPGHITVLWKHVQHDPKRFSELLMELALGGVGGKPGGQDNIALVGLKRPG